MYQMASYICLFHVKNKVMIDTIMFYDEQLLLHIGILFLTILMNMLGYVPLGRSDGDPEVTAGGS